MPTKLTSLSIYTVNTSGATKKKALRFPFSNKNNQKGVHIYNFLQLWLSFVYFVNVALRLF